MRYTKAARQRIIERYAREHDGTFDAPGFVREVQGDLEHEARGYFNWSDEACAFSHRTEQARKFAMGLKITFTVQDVETRRNMRVRTRTVPLLHSPIGGRKQGGGYQLTDANNPQHMAALCNEAATSLQTWLNRYGSSVEHAGGSKRRIERQIQKLRDASTVSDEAA